MTWTLYQANFSYRSLHSADSQTSSIVDFSKYKYVVNRTKFPSCWTWLGPLNLAQNKPYLMIALEQLMTSRHSFIWELWSIFFGCYITKKMSAFTTMLDKYNNIKVFENNIGPALNCVTGIIVLLLFIFKYEFELKKVPNFNCLSKLCKAIFHHNKLWK